MTSEEYREWLLNTVRESQCVYCKHCIRITQEYNDGAYVTCPKLKGIRSIRTIFYCKYFNLRRNKDD